MRSVIHLRAVLGLLAISSAVASPCKPATAVTSATSTKTSLVTSLASTTDDASATPSTVVETTVEISVSSSKTSASSVEVSDSSVTIETSATSATTDFTTEHTTAEPSTTDLTTTAETTTTAAIPTFTMFASGSNAITGKSLQSYSRDNAVVVFDPATDDDNPSVRQYSIDSQGRLVNDLGWFLCGYYRTTNDELNKPATVVTCHGETPLQAAFLTCELSGSFGISCSVPAVSCTSTGSPDTPPACVAAAGTWSLNSVGVRAFGHTWQIGNSDTPATYERMAMSIREV
ncbi:hypothetical protein DER45DRAFT_598945 [Fusarium avenaceum]|nr:hypothetical protein DER45DRAFT_598945 [Fusarium avenaceum]